jgi:hypothetical protein
MTHESTDAKARMFWVRRVLVFLSLTGEYREAAKEWKEVELMARTGECFPGLPVVRWSLPRWG